MARGICAYCGNSGGTEVGDQGYIFHQECLNKHSREQNGLKILSRTCIILGAIISAWFLYFCYTIISKIAD